MSRVYVGERERENVCVREGENVCVFAAMECVLVRVCVSAPFCFIMCARVCSGIVCNVSLTVCEQALVCVCACVRVCVCVLL